MAALEESIAAVKGTEPARAKGDGKPAKKKPAKKSASGRKSKAAPKRSSKSKAKASK
jgi:hypothetical protein